MNTKNILRKYSKPTVVALGFGALAVSITACSSVPETPSGNAGVEEYELTLLDEESARKVGEMEDIAFFSGEALASGPGVGTCVAAVRDNSVLLEGCSTGSSVNISSDSLLVAYFPQQGGSKPQGYAEVSPGLFALTK